MHSLYQLVAHSPTMLLALFNPRGWPRNFMKVVVSYLIGAGYISTDSETVNSTAIGTIRGLPDA